MLQHKLNKTTKISIKKICTFSNVSFLLCLSIPRPCDVQMDTLVHKSAHTGTFRQINVSLAGVKLLCVHIYT